MPPRALALLLLCAAVLASVTVAGVHLLTGSATAADRVTDRATVIAPVTPVPATSAPVAVPRTGTPAVEPAPTSTRTVDLSPVTASGAPAEGWTVTAGDTEVECGYASPAAVSPGVQTCSPTAASADVCWPAPGGRTVTCLMDPWTTELVRYPATGADVQVAAPERPRPVGLELADGTHCRLRNGGAWSGRDDDPDAYGAYGCSQDEADIVWATQDADPIDESAPTWTVRVGSPSGPLRTVGVAVAYYAS